MRILMAVFTAMVLIISAFAGETLFDRLGGKPGLARITARMVDNAVVDPKIGTYFKDANVPRLKGLLTAHFCQITGGGCSYPGRDMKTSHADLNIDDRAFNRLVEVLQLAMDEEGVPFATQNELLSILAPMHGEVVNR